MQLYDEGMHGRIHAIETLGMLDGPGVRTVVFMQGCHLRCAYCHNPETWNPNGGQIMTTEVLFNRIRRNVPYFGKEGGVTLSGGEPLLQAKFAARLLKTCKDAGIGTAIDTAGVSVDADILEALRHTDLVILDIKMPDEERYKEITGGSLETTLRFMKTAARMGCRIWIRHVVVPGLNDTVEDLEALESLLESTGICFEKVELLPYHRMGVGKYELLDIPYKLSKVPEMVEVSY